jgi:hypothetical protein
MVDFGSTRAENLCVQDDTRFDTNVFGSCDREDTFEYAIDSFRVGGLARLMTAGEKLRFTSTLGVGAVRHAFRTIDPERNIAGMDAYLMAELGLQFNFGHTLFEVVGVLYWEGRDALHGDFGRGDIKLFQEGGLRSGGLGLKLGWGEWTPYEPAKETALH